MVEAVKQAPDDLPITFEDIALLAGVEKKTVHNAASNWKKVEPSIGDPCSYRLVRPFLLAKWAKKEMMFPADCRQLQEIIRSRQ
jgi:hypothetical protein